MRRARGCQRAQSASKPAEGSKLAPIGLTSPAPMTLPTIRVLTDHFVRALLQSLSGHFAVSDFADSANCPHPAANFECTELFDPALHPEGVVCLERTAPPGPE